MLTLEQKLNYISRTHLTRFQTDPGNFHHRLVSQDGTLVHHFEPKSKIQSKQWKHHGSPLKDVYAYSKMMDYVFLDSEGVIMTDYLEKRNAFSGDYHASKLAQLKAAINQKRRGKLRADVLLLQAKAPVYTAQVSVAAAANCGFE